MRKEIPDWLANCLRVALLGEVYPSVRAIAVDYLESGLLLRYYLDRHPTVFDFESIEVVATNLDASKPDGSIKTIDVECLFFDGPISQMDSLSGFAFARREYDMNEEMT